MYTAIKTVHAFPPLSMSLASTSHSSTVTHSEQRGADFFNGGSDTHDVSRQHRGGLNGSAVGGGSGRRIGKLRRLLSYSEQNSDICLVVVMQRRFAAAASAKTATAGFLPQGVAVPSPSPPPRPPAGIEVIEPLFLHRNLSLALRHRLQHPRARPPSLVAPARTTALATAAIGRGGSVGETREGISVLIAYTGLREVADSL